MKVLFFYQHFWPDSPPYANMLRVIGAGLSNGGDTVSVITGQPSYKKTDRLAAAPTSEQVDGISVKRLQALPGAQSINFLRIMGKAVFPLRAFISVLVSSFKGDKHDVIVAATIPPVVNGLFAYLAAKCTGAKFIYHLQDIYPEIGAVGGLWSTTSLRHKVLKYLDSKVCQRADVCVTLSKDMADSLLSRGVNESRIVVINNFMLADFESSNEGRSDVEIQSKDTGYKIVFAGNLGRFQGLEELLEAFLNFAKTHPSLELHFVGDGLVADELKKQASGCSRVYFYGHQSFDRACSLITQCDAGVVSIQPEIYKYAYPSKTLTYLGLGVPLLALIEEKSAMAAEISNLKLGVSASNTSIAAIENGFEELVDFLDGDLNNQARIKLAFSENMSTKAALLNWSSLVTGIGTERNRRVSTHE